MSAIDLLQSLTARAIRLESVEGRLRVDAPLDTLTHLDRQAITAHKADLLAVLAGNWDSAEATRLVTSALALWPPTTGANPTAWRRLTPLADQIDTAVLGRDMTGLRAAVRLFLETAVAEKPPD